MRGTLGGLTCRRVDWDHPRVCGNTSSGHVLDLTYRDHPRVCGEHNRWEYLVRSPNGIIPAYAGNTVESRLRGSQRGDHPRVCGEHRWFLGLLSHALGIIPAYAGNTDGLVCDAVASLDHPAYAGNTIRRKASWHFSAGSSPRMPGTRPRNGFAFGLIRDHPRVCGEHL